MNRKLMLLTVSTLLIFAVIFPAAAESTLKIENGTTTIGGTTTVTITAFNVIDLANFDITVTYNASVVNVTNAINNPALGAEINNLEQASNGMVRLANFNLFGGQSGDILVSTLTLNSTGDSGQVSDLNLTVNTFVTSSEQNILVSVENGTFTIEPLSDTTNPVITLLGTSPIDVEVDSVYTDAGATASDTYDGDLTSSIVTVNPVDNTIVGTYIVTYNVVDSSGNAATEVTRTVNVIDIGTPVITLLGTSPIDVEVDSVYTDAGATASDTYDGDLTSSIVTVNPVDNTIVGTYIVTYNVVDSSGNAATEVTRTVNVIDIGTPVITLLGTSPIDVEVDSVYTDAGATASDTYDGDLTSSIVTVNPVDNTIVGTYIVTYNVVDSSGNAATEVTRTVNVVDIGTPVITLLGTSPIDVEVDSVYTDAGATASDTYDGDLTSSIVTVNPVDNTIVGTYIVTYNVVDSSGNAATEVTRTVNVVDIGTPVITLLGTSPIDVEVGSVYTDAGATASDTYDGDLTSSIVTVNPVDNTIVGTYIVTYNVVDSSGNAATEVTRTVNVVDIGTPVITLLGTSPIDVEVGSVYTDAGATASDTYEGDLTSSIVTVNPVDNTIVGTYIVTYNVVDSSGNAATEVTRTVNVVDIGTPVITLLGTSPIDVEVGSVYTDAGATASDTYEGDLTSSIVTVNPVDNTIVGTYIVTYNVVDSSGNAATEVTRTVNVIDIGTPVITLLGTSPIDVEVDSVYTDAGATASDTYDGDLTSSIVTVNPVDNTIVGTYIVTYNVVDSSGNAATEVTRTVNVVDIGTPVITLLGTSPIDVEVGSVYTDAGATASDTYDGDLTSSIVTVNPVDNTIVGTYIVTYNVVDSSGNAATEVTRTVNVVDIGTPVITLLGTSPIDVEVGSVYTDAGATASDTYDGDLTSSIVTVNPVDNTIVGTYIVTYNVVDSSGNAATEVTRTVNVIDIGTPVITLLGTSPIDVEVDSVYTDAGATASDTYDGDLTSSIVTVNPVDNTIVGTYIVTYNVVDSSGNAATEVTRTVNVVDIGTPVITLLGTSPIDVEVGSVYTDAGATASDTYDGDLTSSIVTVNPVDNTIVGTYIVTYNVVDSSGNAATEVTRTVNVIDIGTPVITLLGTSPIDVEVDSVYTDAGATASDTYDGDLTSSIVTVNPVDNTIVGTYIVTYNVVDSSGNAATEVTRTVNVVDIGTPVITLLGTSPIDVEVGSVYTDAGATASDTYDGDLTSSIVTVNPVDNTIVGTYIVTYNVVDSSGNAATEVTRTVNVVDIGAPIAYNQSTTTPEDTPVDITLSATDVDGDSLTYSIVGDPSHGTVTLIGNVSTYTPDTNYNGADSFTFKANDGTLDSNTATVSITVVLGDTIVPELILELVTEGNISTLYINSSEPLLNCTVNGTKITPEDEFNWSKILEANGTYNIIATDLAGNKALRNLTLEIGIIPETDNNNQTNYSTGNVTINITTSQPVGDSNITICEYDENPVGTLGTTTISLLGINKFVQIEVDPELNESIGTVRISINYSGSDLTGIDVDSLKLYLWNASIESWEVLEPSEIDKVKMIVWGELNHLSLFGILGEEPAEYVPPGNDDKGSSSSGGGSGASGELYENIACSETDRQYVNHNSDISYSFELECNIVQYVNFTGLINGGKIATKVEILKDTSSLVDNPPSNIVYKHLNIWVRNAEWATKKNIDDATVVFTVEKSWITENNIDETSIALYRYSDDGWHELVTRNIAEDATSLQFESETPGFSPFAVTGIELKGKPGGEGIIPEPTVTMEKNPTPTEEKGMPGFGIFAGLSVLLIAMQLLRKKN